MPASWALVLILLALAFAVSSFAFVQPAFAGQSYPKLWGSMEIMSKNTARFPKWADMLRRWHNGAPCDTPTCTNKGWDSFIDSLRGKDKMTQIKEVNRILNLKPYILDMQNWGVPDYWETPFEFLKKSGDCHSYAIAKYFALKALGMPIDDMRIIVLHDLNLNLGHAVLIVYYDGQQLLLDNQISTVVPAEVVKHYQPVYSINENHWWLHVR